MAELIEPRLLLKDRRKLIFEQGPARRQLSRLRPADVVAAGDEGGDTFTALPKESDEAADIGIDFVYVDRDHERVAVELKFTRSINDLGIRGSFSQLWERLRERYSRFDRIELWSLDQNLNLSIWSPNTNGQPNLYGLANVVDTSSPKSSSLDSNGIQRRATEWREKISALFNQVTIWVRTKGYLVNRAAIIPMNEELMQLFGVAPIDLPILKILESKVLVATIVPIGLWTIGGYGF